MGWVAGAIDKKAISASVEVEVEAEAEFGYSFQFSKNYLQASKNCKHSNISQSSIRLSGCPGHTIRILSKKIRLKENILAEVL